MACNERHSFGNVAPPDPLPVNRIECQPHLVDFGRTCGYSSSQFRCSLPLGNFRCKMSASRPSIGMLVPRVLIHAAVLLASISDLSAQTTVGTGSVVGTVSDASGAVISGARVTISNVATGQFISVTTTSSGSFNSGALIPGNYKALVAARGFRSAEATISVLVGNTTSVSVKLQIGSGKETVEVQDSPSRVNTEQPTVQGVLTEEQIENLPVNGRNFLDLAQLEPGVQSRTEQTSAWIKMDFRPFLLAAVSGVRRASR